MNSTDSNTPAHPVVGVVVALSRVRSDRREFLLIRRSASVSLPLRVCFPGGRLEPGESLEAAAAREMQEELGVSISALSHVWDHLDPQTSRSSGRNRGLHLHGFTAELAPADQVFAPAPAEVAELLWLTESEILAHPDGLPNTARFLQAILKAT